MIMKKRLFVLPIIMFITLAVLSADIFWSSDAELEMGKPGTAEIEAYWNLDTIQSLSNYDVWFESDEGRLEDNATVSLGGTYIQGVGTYKIGWDITAFDAYNIYLSSSGPFKNDEEKNIDWVAEWFVYGTGESMTLGSIDGTQPYNAAKLVYRHNPQTDSIHSSGAVDFEITTENYEISDKENDIYSTYLYITISDNSGSQV